MDLSKEYLKLKGYIEIDKKLTNEDNIILRKILYYEEIEDDLSGYPEEDGIFELEENTIYCHDRETYYYKDWIIIVVKELSKKGYNLNGKFITYGSHVEYNTCIKIINNEIQIIEHEDYFKKIIEKI